MPSQPLQLDMPGSHTPQLEGAPRSQMHEMRLGSIAPGVVPNTPPSMEEKGQPHETPTDTNG